MSTDRKVVSVKEAVALFDAGKTRKEIKEHFGLTVAEMAQLCKHPGLKNRRTKIESKLEIIDDYEAPQPDSIEEDKHVPQRPAPVGSSTNTEIPAQALAIPDSAPATPATPVTETEENKPAGEDW